MTTLSPAATKHIEAVRDFYNAVDAEPTWVERQYREFLAHCYNLLIPSKASVIEIGCGRGHLLALLHGARRVGVDVSAKQVRCAQQHVPAGVFYVQSGEELVLDEAFDCIILSETVNIAADVQRLFSNLHRIAHPKTRLILNFHNAFWRPLFSAAVRLGLKRRQPESNWLSRSDLQNLLELADWEVITTSSHVLCPVKCLGLEWLLNRCLAPLFPHLCLTTFCVARPKPRADGRQFTTSVVIPVRTEAGNIEALVRRVPHLGERTELIFVEGHSRDDSWAEIQRVARTYADRNIVCIQQPGTGKGDAVRAGFAVAGGDILMILDADMTVPPEELTKFFEVIASGRAELANGVRLVYPMEEHAMRLLNLCANKVFSVLFSWFLSQNVKDTLCGTKAILHNDYKRLLANRDDLGSLDPFGDFDLLLGAGKLKLKIADVAVRYTCRSYGASSIARWRHGWLLLRMVILAARRLKFV